MVKHQKFSKYYDHGSTFLYSIKLYEYKIGIKFDKDPLAIEQNSYLTKIVSVYIVYDLDAWPKLPLRNFTLKSCLFRATNVVKNSDKERHVLSGYGIAFDKKAE